METLRGFYQKYVDEENETNNYGVSDENRQEIVDIIEVLGPEACRPVARLMLQNWNEINSRIEEYDETDWKQAKAVAQSSNGAISEHAAAMLTEVLEGEDTSMQNILTGPLPELNRARFEAMQREYAAQIKRIATAEVKNKQQDTAEANESQDK